jgi:acetolactate synthase-1/2/3 large subunit
MDVAGLRVTKQEELHRILERGLQMEGPVLIDVLLPEAQDVLPMVPPGGRLDQMVLRGEL